MPSLLSAARFWQSHSQFSKSPAISSDDYLALVSASVGMDEAMRPYRVVAYVSGGLIIENLVGAILWPLALDWSKVG